MCGASQGSMLGAVLDRRSTWQGSQPGAKVAGHGRCQIGQPLLQDHPARNGTRKNTYIHKLDVMELCMW
jgi:hypothetical protein